MALIILDRDDHYIGVEKQGKLVILKHRHFEKMKEHDWDDLYFTKEQARKLFKGMLNKKYGKQIKKIKNSWGTWRDDFFGKQLELDAFELRGSDEEKNTSVNVYWFKRKGEEIEFQMHYNTSWIGMGEREAKELHEQLKKVLK